MTRCARYMAGLLLMTGVCAGGNGCGSRPAPDLARVAVADVPAAQVVARVNGRPIGLQALRDQAAGTSSVRAALDALIDEELLQQEASRRGLQHSFRVRRALSQALANRLVTRDFVTQFSAKKIPADMVREAYELNKPRYVHPDLVRLIHIVALADEHAPAELRDKARRAAQLVRREAKRRHLDPQGFTRLARELRDAAAPVRLRAERLTTPGRGHVVASFADAAFAMTRPGQISDVVETRYGYHVIYFLERLPARDVSLQQADAEVRDRIYDDARRELLGRKLTELRARYPVHIDSEALRVAVSRLDQSGAP